MGKLRRFDVYLQSLACNKMKKISLKITALLLGWMSFSALAEQTVDIEIRGIKGDARFAILT